MAGPVRKAVFPVAGRGTRMLPMTRAVPKDMIPVVDRPLIQYAVEEAVEAGVRELIFVTDRPRPDLEAHFRAVPALAGLVEIGVHGEALDAARGLLPDDVRIVLACQPEPLGLGHAVWCAREAVGDEPFAVLLPDDLLVPGCLGSLVETFRACRASGVLAVEAIQPADSIRYGIVDLEGADGAGAGGRVGRVRSIVEKPPPEQAPSNLGVVGRYVFDASILRVLADLPPGAGGEIQLTDGVAKIAPEGGLYASRFDGTRFDCGNRLGWLRATLALALVADASVGGELRRDFASRLAAGPGER